MNENTALPVLDRREVWHALASKKSDTASTDPRTKRIHSLHPAEDPPLVRTPNNGQAATEKDEHRTEVFGEQVTKRKGNTKSVYYTIPVSNGGVLFQHMPSLDRSPCPRFDLCIEVYICICTWPHYKILHVSTSISFTSFSFRSCVMLFVRVVLLVWSSDEQKEDVCFCNCLVLPNTRWVGNLCGMTRGGLNGVKSLSGRLRRSV